MGKPKNLATFRDVLIAPHIEPGTLCHLGVVGNHVVEDWHFMFAEDGGLKFRTNCQTSTCGMQDMPWGDVIEFWPLPTVWVLREEPDERYTVTKYRVLKSRNSAALTFLERSGQIYKDLKGEVAEKINRFEQQRQAVLSFGRLMTYPVRLED